VPERAAAGASAAALVVAWPTAVHRFGRHSRNRRTATSRRAVAAIASTQCTAGSLKPLPQIPGADKDLPRLASWVVVADVRPHEGSKGRFELASLPEPGFAGQPRPMMEIVVRAGEFTAGDKALLLSPGAQVPPELANQSGWEGLLERSDFEVRPFHFGPVRSHGLLLTVEQAGLEGAHVQDPAAVLGIDTSKASRRFLLELGFLGEHFHGSRNTGNEEQSPTVIGELMRATKRLGLPVGGQSAAGPAAWSALSCVDRGVQARSFWVATPLLRVPRAEVPLGRHSRGLALRLMRELPASVHIHRAVAMPFACDFHHSRSAASREYRYYLPLELLGGMDDARQRLQAALRRFVGDQCFASFTELKKLGLKEEIKQSASLQEWAAELSKWRRLRREAGYRPGTSISGITVHPTVAAATQRTVLKAGLVEAPAAAGELLCIRVVGRGFLYNMVRYMVGAAVAVAQGVLQEEALDEALQGKVCADLSEYLAPACGLVLHCQSLRRLPWLTHSTSSRALESAAADSFLERDILPAIHDAWRKRLTEAGPDPPQHGGLKSLTRASA